MAATKGTWRRFAFFDKDVINDNIEAVLGSKPLVAVAEGGMLLFGDADGSIAITDRNFIITERCRKVFRGPVAGLSYVLDASSQKQFVIAVGDDSRGAGSASAVDGVASFTIKVFNAADLSRPIQSFPAAGPVGQIPALQSASLTSFAVLSDGSEIAVGYSNGIVLLYVGNFLREAALGKQLVPILLLQQSPERGPIPAVSGLHFCELPVIKPNERRIRLFVVRDTQAVISAAGGAPAANTRPPEPSFTGVDNPDDAGILVVDTSVVVSASGVFLNNNRRFPHTLDEVGAAAGCTSLSKGTKELLVGRKEGVFTYSIEDRGGAAAFEGPKQCICSVGRYVLVSCLDEETNRTQITVYDLRNKYVGMNSTLPSSEKVLMVMQDGDTAYVVTSKYTLIRFREKDTSEKLAVLLKKFYYPLAISLAAEEQCEVSQIMSLYKLYGDHLYKKNEFDAAMVQYCATIGHLQPSYVVRQYLDNSRIGNLIIYLEKLHERRLATRDLTTLLLTCYTKMKDETKIAEFVNRESSSDAVRSNVLNTGANAVGSTGIDKTASNQDGISGGIDVPSSVNVLHTSGFTSYALQLAHHHRLHAQFIQIQLTKPVPDVKVALAYLAALVFEADVSAQQLNDIVISHGRKLLSLDADAFTALMIKFCLEDYSFISAYQHQHQHPHATSTSASASTSTSTSSKVTINATTTTTTTNGSTMSVPAVVQPNSIAALAQQQSTRNASKHQAPVSVSELLALYSVQHQKHLKLLLEGVFDGLRSRTRLIHGKITVTLLEIYLGEYQEYSESMSKLQHNKQSDDYKELENAVKGLETRIMSILDGNHVQYDASHALLLCHSYNFQTGSQFLLEKVCEATDLLVKQHIENENDAGLFKIMRLQGRKDPELYMQILKYFVDKTIAENAKYSHSHGANNNNQTDNNTNRNNNNNKAASGREESESSDSDSEDDDERWDNISEVLDLIESQNVLTPTQVISVLSRNPELPFSLVSSYVTKTIADVVSECSYLEQLTTGTQREIETLWQTSSAKRVLAANHFVPLHSKGKKSTSALEDDDDDMEEEMQNVVAQEKLNTKKRFVEMQANMQLKSKEHEKFYADLEKDADGFSVVASYFNQYW